MQKCPPGRSGRRAGRHGKSLKMNTSSGSFMLRAMLVMQSMMREPWLSTRQPG
jgi:hypothetical protein